MGPVFFLYVNGESTAYSLEALATLWYRCAYDYLLTLQDGRAAFIRILWPVSRTDPAAILILLNLQLYLQFGEYLSLESLS